MSFRSALIFFVVFFVAITLATKDVPAKSRLVVASCYGPGLFGNRTANGSILTPSTIGAAHRSLRFNTRIVFKTNGKRVAARIIDRGPYVPGRSFDLTQAAVQKLGYGSCAMFGIRTIKASK